MKRKDFILITAAGLTAISIPIVYAYLTKSEYDSLLAQPKSLSVIWDNQTINDIGNKYRSQVPGENRERLLVKQLLSGTDSHNLALSLEEKIIRDFETGNTIIVDGWILSITEARQCALSSTIQPK
jgi:hypothetical protein